MFVIKKQECINNVDINVEVHENESQKLCFDIGANIGNWSLANVNNYNKIISVEASEKTFKNLLKNVNECVKIIPLNYAVCDSKEEGISAL